MFVLLGLVAVRAAETQETWDSEPYRIRALLAVDAPGQLADVFAAELPAYLQERVPATTGPVGRLNVDAATGSLRHRLLDAIDAVAAEGLADAAADENKRLLVTLRASPWGYRLAARE